MVRAGNKGTAYGPIYASRICKKVVGGPWAIWNSAVGNEYEDVAKGKIHKLTMRRFGEVVVDGAHTEDVLVMV